MINVSGAADNCLFTNFSWLHKNYEEGRIVQRNKDTELFFEYDDVGNNLGGDDNKIEKGSQNGSSVSMQGS